ncbi:DUF7674 family protein [Capnocytophaga bilenii]
MNKKDFLNKLIECFPDMKEEILDDDYNGLFSLQIGVFRDITQKAIDTHDLENVEKYTQFILDNFDDFDDDVNNSIVLSYIQKLNFKDYKIPSFFMNFQKELKEYEQSSYTDEKLIDFLKSIKK